MESSSPASSASNIPSQRLAFMEARKRFEARLLKQENPKKAPRLAMRPVPTATSAAATPSAPLLRFEVLYCAKSAKTQRHHKKFRDGVLEFNPSAGTASLTDTDSAKSVFAKMRHAAPIAEDTTVVIAGRFEVEVGSAIAEADFLAGRCFGGGQASEPPKAIVVPKQPFRPIMAALNNSTPAAAAAAAPKKKPPAPLYNPSLPDALVLSAAPPVAVVVDPLLGRVLRPHQREGVSFMWRAIQRSGCILADDMGLGKTLQSLAVLWTALKQGGQPASGRVTPLARRAVVACPASLVDNWCAETRRWLGDTRLRAVACRGADAAAAAKAFVATTAPQLLVVPYEVLRNDAVCGTLANHVQLMVLDEGHRLKAGGNTATGAALLKVCCPRLVLLTGTPLQNNLGELYELVNLVAPALLGTPENFRRVFRTPIERSRERGASPAEVELGRARAEELKAVAGSVMLRRTADVNARYLPEKTTRVVFVRLPKAQREAYVDVLREHGVAGGGAGSGSNVLPAIQALRQACLLGPAAASSRSCKFDAARAIARACKHTNEKVVLVSGFCTALTALADALAADGVKHCSLTGAVPPADRQDIVDRFNKDPDTVACLLSTTAGGVGLNLVGASRLVLLDSSWNPAADAQAMARVWREGQTRHVHIYRLVAAGTIEEKVYQRQLAKGEVGGTVLDSAGDSSSSGGAFTKEELRELFAMPADLAEPASESRANAGSDAVLDAAVRTGVVLWVDPAAPTTAAA